MTWFTENSTFPLITGALLATVFLLLALASREKWVLYVFLGIVGVTAAIVAVESMIVTTREEVTERVYNLAFHVQNNDVERVMEYVDPDDEEIRARVRAEMPRYDFDTCRMTGVTEFQSLGGQPERCEIVFNVVVRLRMNEAPELLAGQRRVKLTLQRDRRGDWRIVDYDHWDPRRGLGL